MEQIEVNIKLAENNKVYNLPIRKSDTILKLKEFCHIISNIPPAQQTLLYKGKILLNEKFINDYDIENNHDIILDKKEEQKPIDIQSFSDNKKINSMEIAKAFEQIPDFLSFYDKLDTNKIDNYIRVMGIGKFSDFFGVEPQEYKELLKDPLYRDDIKNKLKDASSIEAVLRNPEIQKKIQNNPFIKLSFQNPHIFYSPQNFQKEQNIFQVNDKNIIENSNHGISVPPDPFGNLNNNQIMNSSGQISNINFSNNNNIEKIFENIGIEIDFKKEYKDQLSQLKDMGFSNEEINIQVLKESKGNINNELKIF